jgi:hypothetical protein
MYRPGETVPTSGIYSVYDAYGSYQGYQRTCVKGEPFPPLTHPAYGFKLYEATQH